MKNNFPSGKQNSGRLLQWIGIGVAIGALINSIRGYLDLASDASTKASLRLQKPIGLKIFNFKPNTALPPLPLPTAQRRITLQGLVCILIVWEDPMAIKVLQQRLMII